MSEDNLNMDLDAEDEYLEDEASDNSKQYMTFKSGDEYYAIELKYVNEIMGITPITEIPEVEDYIRGLINLRGKIVPVMDVRIRFNQEPFEYNDRTCIIIVNVKNTVIGLIVETIADVVTIRDEDIEIPDILTSNKAKNRYVYGLGKVGDDVKVILNLEMLIRDEDITVLDEIIEEEITE